MRLMAALIVAGFGLWFAPRQMFGRITAALTAWRHFKATADFDLVYRRMRVCWRCPLFYSPLRTCGTPLKRDLRDLGCWCNMEAKAALLESECWLDENQCDTQGCGWTANIPDAGAGLDSDHGSD